MFTCGDLGPAPWSAMSTDFKALIATLRDRHQLAHQERRAQRRARHEAVIAKALRMQAEGRITGQQVAELHALRLRIDELDA
jgi:hypothetical protein